MNGYSVMGIFRLDLKSQVVIQPPVAGYVKISDTLRCRPYIAQHVGIRKLNCYNIKILSGHTSVLAIISTEDASFSTSSVVL